MEFRLTDEQTGFAQSLGELLRNADAIAAARAWSVGDHGPGLELWRRLADQGVSALVVPESSGGLGGTPADLVVAFEVLGHELAVGPWVESAAYLASALDGTAREQVAGGTVATVALPPQVPLALDADVAERAYLHQDGVLVAGEPGALHVSVDTTRRLFDLAPAGPVGLSGGSTAPVGAAPFDLAALATAAELLGCGERLLADTVAYVQQRRQYGRVIGSYQALKHQLADVRIALDFARPLVHGAALRAAGEPAGAGREVSAAKVAAGDAAYLASRVGLQLHGAVGYTAELDLGLWVARVRALVGAWGTTAWHRGRIASRLVGAG